MQELMDLLATWLEPAWARALGIVVVSLLVAWIADRLVCGLFKGLASRTQTDLDDRIIALMHRPIYISVVLYGLWVASGMLHTFDALDLAIRRGVLTGAILIWCLTALRVFRVVFNPQAGSRSPGWLQTRTMPLIHNVALLVLFAGATFALLKVWNLDIAPWIASAGIAGIAVAFAAKDTLANLFGGFSVIVDAPYKIGDFVNLDGGERGMVTAIGLRSTRMLTRDDIEVTIPNSQIANAKIVNETGGRWSKLRVRVNVGVAYGSDIDRVREVLLDAARSISYTLDDPQPGVRFERMGDSALDFRVQIWIEQPVDRGRAIDELNCAIYKALGDAGIQIPFPQRVVHLNRGD